MCTCIQPCEALSKQFYIQISLLQINPVQIGNLQLSTCRRLQLLRILYNMIIIEVKTGYTIITLRLCRLLFNRNCLSILIKLYNTKTLRIIYIITKYGSSFSALCILHSRFQALLQTMSSKNIIAQYHCHRIITNEIRTNDKRLRQSIW